MLAQLTAWYSTLTFYGSEINFSSLWRQVSDMICDIIIESGSETWEVAKFNFLLTKTAHGRALWINIGLDSESGKQTENSIFLGYTKSQSESEKEIDIRIANAIFLPTHPIHTRIKDLAATIILEATNFSNLFSSILLFCNIVNYYSFSTNMYICE